MRNPFKRQNRFRSNTRFSTLTEVKSVSMPNHISFGGGVMWAEDGVLMWRNDAGKVTRLAPPLEDPI